MTEGVDQSRYAAAPAMELLQGAGAEEMGITAPGFDQSALDVDATGVGAQGSERRAENAIRCSRGRSA